MCASTPVRPRVRRAASSLLLWAAAAACVSPAASRHTVLLDDWRRSQPDTAVLGADALFHGEPVLLRATLIERVLARNPNLRAARHAWRAALARHPQVTALDDPLLAAGLAPRSLSSSSVDTGTKWDLQQRLPFPGKLRIRGAVALAEAEAASHDFDLVRLRLAWIASTLFDEYVLVARSLEINAAHLVLLEELKRIATARYEAGEAAQQDPIQAEVELAHALHQEVVLETTRRVTIEQLNALLHRALDHPLPAAPVRSEVPAQDRDDVDQLIAGALERHPRLAAERARTAAEEARLALERREYLPDFTLMGSYNRIHQEADLQPFLGLQLDLPLQLGRRRAAVEEAAARVAMARSRLAAATDEVWLGASSAAARLGETRRVAALFRDRLVPAARDQVDAARSGFETGRNGFSVLIDAERNLRNVELDLARTEAELARRRADLDRSLGRVPGLAW